MLPFNTPKYRPYSSNSSMSNANFLLLAAALLAPTLSVDCWAHIYTCGTSTTLRLPFRSLETDRLHEHVRVSIILNKALFRKFMATVNVPHVRFVQLYLLWVLEYTCTSHSQHVYVVQCSTQLLHNPYYLHPIMQASPTHTRSNIKTF